MKHTWIGWVAVAVLATPVFARAQAPSLPASRPTPPTVAVGGMAGFAGGLSLQAQVLARGLAPSLPVEARLRLGYTRTDPGSASEARRIFINNATNGTPEESGRVLDLDLDVLWRAGWVPGDQGLLFAGVRHTRFRGNFRYIGGNEDFDVTSSHWGLGVGAESRYAVGPRTFLVVNAGLDLFPGARLQGHDTSYSPDGDHVNPRQDFGYDDADGAINQPRVRPVILVGFTRRMGG